LLILGLDTATLSCSVALLRDDTVLAEMTLNIKKTHSERLMPLLDTLLTESGVEREQIDAIAAAAGPGSFTGLRIGMATARGLAQGLAIPAVPVSTLEAMAEAVPAPAVLICPLLDARRGEVYTALYQREDLPPHNLKTLLEPEAVNLNFLIKKLLQYSLPVVFLGEGLPVCEAELRKALPPERLVIAASPLRLCRASLVALCGRRLLEKNPQASYEELLPFYLRRPEAERMAAKKQGGSA